jgi:hypothetical protein
MNDKNELLSTMGLVGEQRGVLLGSHYTGEEGARDTCGFMLELETGAPAMWERGR